MFRSHSLHVTFCAPRGNHQCQTSGATPQPLLGVSGGVERPGLYFWGHGTGRVVVPDLGFHRGTLAAEARHSNHPPSRSHFNRHRFNANHRRLVRASGPPSRAPHISLILLTLLTLLLRLVSFILRVALRHLFTPQKQLLLHGRRVFLLPQVVRLLLDLRRCQWGKLPCGRLHAVADIQCTPVLATVCRVSNGARPAQGPHHNHPMVLVQGVLQPQHPRGHPLLVRILLFFLPFLLCIRVLLFLLALLLFFLLLRLLPILTRLLLLRGDNLVINLVLGNRLQQLLFLFFLFGLFLLLLLGLLLVLVNLLLRHFGGTPGLVQVLEVMHPVLPVCKGLHPLLELRDLLRSIREGAGLLLLGLRGHALLLFLLLLLLLFLVLVFSENSRWTDLRAGRNTRDLGTQIIDLFARELRVAAHVRIQIPGEILLDVAGSIDLLRGHIRQMRPRGVGV
mmetsp:Transcript_27505/g.46695  ORF Transcript_27505/g.46695 Transcript_27505/m.46695 type:complete len:450 (-) Transcript_27505:761-2110(-)